MEALIYVVAVLVVAGCFLVGAWLLGLFGTRD